MAILDADQRSLVQTMMPLVLGLDANEAGNVQLAVERLEDYLRALPSKKDPDKVVLVINVLNSMALLHYGAVVGQLQPNLRQDFYRKIFDADKKWKNNAIDVAARLFGTGTTLRDLAKALREIMCLAFYSSPTTFAHTKYQALWLRQSALQVDPALANAAGFTRNNRTRLDLDAIARKRLEGADVPHGQLFANNGKPKVAIIGSGCGGSVVAAQLAGKYDVAVFESGPRFSPSQFPLDPMASMALMYQHGLMTPTKDLDVRLLRARVVGGGSVVNIGLSVRTPERIITKWVNGGMGLDPVKLRAALDVIEKRQRFVDFNPAVMTDAAHRWKSGLDAMKAPNGQPLLNVRTVQSDVCTHAHQHPVPPAPDVKGAFCVGCGMCNYGCRFGHHYTVDRSFLRDAEAAGAKVHPNHRISELVGTLTPDGKKVKITGIRLGREPNAPPVRVDHVVLCAGSVGTPQLYLSSAEDQPVLRRIPPFELVGKKFGMNYGTPVVARWNAAMQKPGWDGLQVSYRVDKTGGNDWMLEGGFLPPGILAAVVPGLGADHRRLMGAYDRLAMAVNTIGTPPVGSVNARGDVSFKVDDKQMGVIHETLAYVVDSYLHGNADEVRVSGVRGLDDTAGTFDATWRGKHKQIAARLAKIAPTADRLALASGHPQGGMRMNADGHKGVVAPNFRVHGTSNLFVADASVFPSTITVNLQWTIMALAWMAGDSIHAAIQAG